MEKNFWKNKWDSGDIGFHKSEVHPLLVKYLPSLNLRPGSRIFLPLCGKSLDIHWLLKNGFKVCGAELIESAVVELFEELKLLPVITTFPKLMRYESQNIVIFVGDIFDLDKNHLGIVDAVYDRAALVALPPETRPRYAEHLQEITASSPELLITFDFPPERKGGPPFHVSKEEVRDLTNKNFELKILEENMTSQEIVWLLQPRNPDILGS